MVMENSFSVRVEKIFGHLDRSGTGNKSSYDDATSPSLWRLSDEEVERRQWNHRNQVEEDDNEFHHSNFGDLLKSDHKEEEEEEEEEEEDDIGGETKRRRRMDVKTIIDEDWDVQSNIGRDCTLDYEEEEDEFDKVAVGEEQNGDRVYMRDLNMTDYQVDELEPNTYRELPYSFPIDPCADHVSAEIRLEEGVEMSGNTDISPISDNSVAKRTDSKVIARRELDTDNPKPILKKKKNLMDSTSQKRVRFSCNPIISSQNELQFSGNPDLLSKYSSGIPDYLRNPSKYTRYSFDSSVNMDDQSNKKACMDISQQPMKGNNTEYNTPADETSADIPKSVTFTPRIKPQVDSTVNRNAKEHRLRNNTKSKGWSVDVTAEDAQEHEASAMEEDEPCAVDDQGCSFQKPSRQYRARNRVNVDCNST